MMHEWSRRWLQCKYFLSSSFFSFPSQQRTATHTLCVIWVMLDGNTAHIHTSTYNTLIGPSECGIQKFVTAEIRHMEDNNTLMGTRRVQHPSDSPGPGKIKSVQLAAGSRRIYIRTEVAYGWNVGRAAVQRGRRGRRPELE